MKISIVLCVAGLAAASNTRTSRITAYGLGESPEPIHRGRVFPLPYTRSASPRAPLSLKDLRYKPVTLLERHPTDPSRLEAEAHRLTTGLENSQGLQHVVQAFQPASDKVALVARLSDLPTLLPDNQAAKPSHTVRGAEEPYLIIKQRSDVLTHMLKELGELEVLDDGVNMVPDPYKFSLFPLHYYIPYSYNNPYSEGLQNPFLAQRHGNPFLYGGGPSVYYDDYPYVPYEGVYRHPFVRREEYNEDDHFYDIYSHPAVKPVAIVPGDEYAIYYPASYPILSTVPFAAAPAPSSVATAAPIAPVSP